MSKFVVGGIASIFLFGSAAAWASGNLSSELPPMSAQDILNTMACAEKNDGDKIKDRIDGQMVTCPNKLKRGENKGKYPSDLGY